MIYIEAPSYDYICGMFEIESELLDMKSVFLAGGIMQCPYWQDEIVELLRYEKSLVLLNPRRKVFPMDDPSESERQIKWEHKHLKIADAILYWFSPPTTNPIVFYELGRYIGSTKQIFVGVDPAFERKNDVYIQAGLVRPEMKIVSTLEELAQQVIAYDNKTSKCRYINSRFV